MQHFHPTYKTIWNFVLHSDPKKKKKKTSQKIMPFVFPRKVGIHYLLCYKYCRSKTMCAHNMCHQLESNV